MNSHQYPILPISDLRADFEAALGAGSILLEAEPGAGKSTLVPLWMLQQARGQVWLIQPRVLPAITLARRLAELVGDDVGQTVGYQVAFDRCQGPATQLLIMTPGVLLQRLLADPELVGVSAVMLDEIHERAVDQDTAWALLQETAILRDDLQLVLMSATPDAALRTQVDMSLYSPGRCYPVEVSYCPVREVGSRAEPIAQQLVRALATHPNWQACTVLVFLPGWRAIDECRQALKAAAPEVLVFCLHSRVDRVEQLAALDAARGARVILATNIAETSLTIADVTLVIDSGLAREPAFEQRTGVTRLQTRRISSASAQQRRGRAGRVQAGCCIRLWPESEALAPQTLPEIRRTDYLPLALRLAHWGTAAAQLPWLEPPGALALQHAQQHLRRWQLLDEGGAITAQGRRVAALGTHPRIAALLLLLEDALTDYPWLLLLALALHFDLTAEATLEEWLSSAERESRRNPQWRKLSKRWQQHLCATIAPSAQLTPLSQTLAGRLAQVFADRIAHRCESGRYRINSGVSVQLADVGEWALVLQIMARGREQVGVGLAVDLTPAQVRQLASVESTLEQLGSAKRRRWVERTCYRVGGQLVDESERPLTESEVPEAILQFIRTQGLAGVPWPTAALSLLARARLLQAQQRVQLPALSETALLGSLTQWLLSFLTPQSDLTALPLLEALRYYLGFDGAREVDRWLPAQVSLPSDRSVAVDYLGDQQPADIIAGEQMCEPRVAAKLQEFFGVAAFSLPASDVALAIELLSPAGRPLAVTRDLAFFWREVYPDVRREVRGRYAKHPWPEDPLSHKATALVKRRL
ncbi:ATP-dependent helicase HrpB [Gilvimarinus polysaccharolyticus]|uniref:ATP-dependent helicase HrpB n=1 Tax=Gilvimarinus polysaccharolyticus TaxID=863921 RepID=UPI000A87C5D2|nr:ATP-dependent helicase HrpB [Gilvimarinus polysaccharolyticus]